MKAMHALWHLVIPMSIPNIITLTADTMVWIFAVACSVAAATLFILVDISSDAAATLRVLLEVCSAFDAICSETVDNSLDEESRGWAS